MWPISAKKIYEVMIKSSVSPEFLNSVIIEGISTDSRVIKKNQMFVAIKGENFDGHKYLKQIFKFDVPLALVQKDSAFISALSDEDKNKCICVEDVLSSLREFAQFFRKSFSFPVIGIGGSNGKTTTKEFLYSLLSGGNHFVTKTDKSENGFLGLPITLLQSDHNENKKPSALVLEIGIDDIGAMQQHVTLSTPDVVLLTALGPEHLDGLKTWDNAAKEELILFSNPNTVKIWQLCDERIHIHYFEELFNGLNLEKDIVVIEKKNYSDYVQKVKSFSKFKSSTEIIWTILNDNGIKLEFSIEIKKKDKETKSIFPLFLSMPGKHNVSNFALAFSAGLSLGREAEELLLGFKNFAPPPMRSNLKHLPNGALLYNDAYNASPFSVIAALDFIEKPDFINKIKFIVLGDMLELGTESNYWHEYLVPAMKKAKLTYLCLYGPSMYSCYKLLYDMKDKLLTENKTEVFWLNSNEDPSFFLTKFNSNVNLSDCVFLVKGSRAMKLERFIKTAEEYCQSSQK